MSGFVLLRATFDETTHPRQFTVYFASDLFRPIRMLEAETRRVRIYINMY